MNEKDVLENLESALKKVKDQKENFGGFMDRFNVDENYVVMKALEKQIPKKIKQDIVDGRMNRKCPNDCVITYLTTYLSINYCPYCGQKIDLGDEEMTEQRSEVEE